MSISIFSPNEREQMQPQWQPCWPRRVTEWDYGVCKEDRKGKKEAGVFGGGTGGGRDGNERKLLFCRRGSGGAESPS
ncbi:RNA-binding protein, putative, partial [Trypanosoma cruzi]